MEIKDKLVEKLNNLRLETLETILINYNNQHIENEENILRYMNEIYGILLTRENKAYKDIKKYLQKDVFIENNSIVEISKKVDNYLKQARLKNINMSLNERNIKKVLKWYSQIMSKLKEEIEEVLKINEITFTK